MIRNRIKARLDWPSKLRVLKNFRQAPNISNRRELTLHVGNVQTITVRFNTLPL